MRYSSALFSYSSTKRKLVCEISDLARVGCSCFGRIYPDACDEGIIVVSEETGQEMTFALDHIEHDRENEIVEWVLLITPESLRKFPALVGLKVVILND